MASEQEKLDGQNSERVTSLVRDIFRDSPVFKSEQLVGDEYFEGLNQKALLLAQISGTDHLIVAERDLSTKGIIERSYLQIITLPEGFDATILRERAKGADRVGYHDLTREAEKLLGDGKELRISTRGDLGGYVILRVQNPTPISKTDSLELVGNLATLQESGEIERLFNASFPNFRK